MLLKSKRLVSARSPRLIFPCLLACLGVYSAHQSNAATLTWAGLAIDGNVFSSANWSSARSPVSGDSLIFSGSNRPNVSFGNTPFSLATLTFDTTAGAFLLSGASTLTLTSAAAISTSSLAVQTIATNLTLGIAQTWTSNTGGRLENNGIVANGGRTLSLSGAGLITINGIHSGTGGLIKSSTGSGTLALNRANTYTGATSLGSGVVLIGDNAAFGTGIVTFASSSLSLEAVGGSRTVANNYLAGTTTNFQGANNLTLGGAGSLTGNSTFTTNGTGVVSLNGIISGTARSLTKNGTGTLALNAANTFTGGTNLSAGTLQLGNNAAAGVGTLSLGSGTFQAGINGLSLANAVSLTGNTTFAGSNNITFHGNATLTGNRIQANNSSALITYNGAISGAFSFSKTGSGNTAYTGTAANIYSGLTSVDDGGLFLGKTGVNAVAGSLRIGDGLGNAASAIVQLNGANQIIDTSALSIYSDGQLRLQNFTDSVGSVTLYGGSVTGTGTLGLGGTLTYSGVSGAQGNISSALNLNGARTLAINDNGIVDADLTISGVVSNGTLTKTGTGTLALGGANTFAGGLNLNAGRLLVGANGALGTGTVNLGDISGGTAASLLIANGQGNTLTNAIASRTGGSGTLTLGGLNTSGVHVFSGLITLGRSISVTAESGGEVDFNGVMSGAGGLTKIGLGTVALNAANTYTGTTVINAGTLVAGAANVLSPTSAFSVSAGAVLDLQGRNNTVASLAGAGSVKLGSATLAVGGNNAATTFSGILSGEGSLVKNGTGIFTISGLNTYTGATNVNRGTLRFGISNSVNPGSALNIASGANLDLITYNATFGSISGTGNITRTSGSLTFGGNNAAATYAGIINGTGAVTKTGTGIQTLSAANTFTGATIIQAGTLEVTANQSLGGTGSIEVHSGGTLLLHGSAATDRVKNTAPISLRGGTIARGSGHEGASASRSALGILTGANTAGLGQLSLTANSSIDFGIGEVGTLSFTNFISNGFVLAILNYTFTTDGAYRDGQSDRLIFATDQSGNLARFHFGSSFGAATQISLGSGFYEITASHLTAVPEPSTWVGAVLLSGLALAQIRRRRQ